MLVLLRTRDSKDRTDGYRENQRAAWELLWPQPQVLRGGLGFWTSKGTPSLRWEETGDSWSEPFVPSPSQTALA